MKRIEAVQTDWLVFYDIKSDEPYKGYELHCHSTCEIYYFICGDVDYNVEGVNFSPSPDSILLIPQNAFHGVKVNSKRLHHRCSVHFPIDILQEPLREGLLQTISSAQVFYPHIGAYRLEHYMHSFLECRDMPGEIKDIALQSRLTALITQVLYMENRGTPIVDNKHKPIQDILDYLNEHIRDNVTLEQLASRFFISKNHLNVLFRESTGTTVRQYMRIKRLALAEQNMRSGMTASQAAIQAGFSDYSNFYRAYRDHYHSKPSNIYEDDVK